MLEAFDENYYVNVARLMYPRPNKKKEFLEDGRPVPFILLSSGEDD